jgi:hypothetical protein
MNSVQIHLALTHVPVIVSLVGLVMLIASLFIKNPMIFKISYILLIVAAVAALPVYFSGEGAEEGIEHMPGISENIIERHEDFAKMGMVSVITAGFFALSALLLFRFVTATRILKVLVLGTAIISGGFMFQTARLGGEIRHSEVTSLAAATDGGGDVNGGNENNSEEDDD